MEIGQFNHLALFVRQFLHDCDQGTFQVGAFFCSQDIFPAFDITIHKYRILYRITLLFSMQVNRQTSCDGQHPCDEGAFGRVVTLDFLPQAHKGVLRDFFSSHPVIKHAIGNGIYGAVGELMGLNRYAYVSNNPVNAADPSGMDQRIDDDRLCPPGMTFFPPSSCGYAGGNWSAVSLSEAWSNFWNTYAGEAILDEARFNLTGQRTEWRNPVDSAKHFVGQMLVPIAEGVDHTSFYSRAALGWEDRPAGMSQLEVSVEAVFGLYDLASVGAFSDVRYGVADRDPLRVGLGIIGIGFFVVGAAGAHSRLQSLRGIQAPVNACGVPAAMEDPLLDNNIMVWIASGDPEALAFANRYRNNMSIDRTVIREFLNGGRASGDLRALIDSYGISPIFGATQSEGVNVAVQLGRQVVEADNQIIATALKNNLRLATGDRRMLSGAVRLGVDARAFRFTGSQAQREAFYRHVWNTLKSLGVNPANHIRDWPQ